MESGNIDERDVKAFCSRFMVVSVCGRVIDLGISVVLLQAERRVWILGKNWRVWTVWVCMLV